MGVIVLLVLGFLGFMSVFAVVLFIFGMYRLLRISEDLRYLRSRTDLSVERPKPAKDDVTKAMFISLGVAILIVFVIVAGKSLVALGM